MENIQDTVEVPNAFKDTTKVTKTEKTQMAYIDRGIQLSKRVGKLLNNNESVVDPRQLAAWLKSNTKEFTKNTFRQYKNALIFYFTHVIKTPIALEAAEYINMLSSEPCSEKSDKTSSKKSKNLNKNKYEKLLSFLLTRNNKYDDFVICWLQAGLLTGLRPSEWRTASLIDYNGNLALKIKNAKNTNGRSNGDTRILLLGNMPDEELNIVKQQLLNIQSNTFDERSFEKFYLNCVQALTSANTTLFGSGKKNITLYSARHQFSANAKAAKVGRDVLAALMGHATDETAATHYGRSMFGNSGGIKVEPIKEQVETVKKYDFSFINRKMEAIQERKRNEKAMLQELPIFDDSNDMNNVATTENIAENIKPTKDNQNKLS